MPSSASDQSGLRFRSWHGRHDRNRNPPHCFSQGSTMPLTPTSRSTALATVLLSGFTALMLIRTGYADGLDKRLEAAEAKRVAVIEKIKPTVTAVFAHGGQGGGSGVVISKDGYALTNFHVTQGSGPVMQCGLPD